MNTADRYRVLILGDVHFGENYTNEGALSLQERGYAHSTQHLKPFAAACDAAVLNLETPLLDPQEITTPLPGKKAARHWGDPDQVVKELKDLGVVAVSLGNDHILDYGAEGLEATFGTLASSGIEWFGAGRTLGEARAPYRLELPERLGGGEVHFHGAHQYSRRSDLEYRFYANHHSPGCAPLKASAVPPARTDATQQDTFHIALPHWGAKYSWRDQGQYRMAHRFLRKDYDLILGHGGHSLQEVHRKQQRWVVYGIGNGILNSAGRWERYQKENGILPYSFWAVFEVNRHSDKRTAVLKLYPVYSNNAATEYSPGPVSTEDFQGIVDTLGSRPARPWRFTNPAQHTGSDDLGHFIELELGEWPDGEQPSRLKLPTPDGDPGDWPLRGPSSEAEDRVLASAKNLGPSMLALPAAAEGGKVKWLSPKLALVESGGKRLLAHTYRAHESALGAAIAKDKVLTAQVLEESGVATPKTLLVASPDDAVQAAGKMTGPVVLKPRNGNKSKGVSTGLVDDQEIRDAFVFARKYGSEIILQQHIDFAEELRVMASSEQALAVNGRLLPHVIGDGTSTIKQLIDDKNLQRTLNPSLRDRPIPVDALTHRQLKRVGLSVDSVPSLGQSVTVRNVAGLSVGGDTFQNLADTSEQLKEAAIGAIAAIPGLSWGGVDLIIEKGTGRPFVIEINHSAAYGAAMFPAYGEPRDVGADVWKLRHAATPTEYEAEPEVSTLHPEPLSLDPEAKLISKGKEAMFSQLFQESLIRQNYTIMERNSRVLQVSAPGGTPQWVTKSGLTPADRSAVQQVMQRHSWIYELLEIAELPRPRAGLVTNKDELIDFMKGGVSRVLLAPALSSWSGISSRVLAREEALAHASSSAKRWIQTRLTGRRIRVLATRDAAQVVTARAASGPLEEDHVTAAGKLAVRAVRAVPELRWAGVDLLLRPRRIRAGRTDGILVEGLTQTPRYSTRDQIFAGHLDEFCRNLLHDSTA